MSKKAKRTLGLICLIFSGLLLIGEGFVLLVPAMAEMAHKSLGDHLRSLLLVFVMGAIGLHLRRARTDDSTAFVLRLVVFVLFLTPLLDIQVALKILLEHGPIALLPNMRIASIVLSLVLVVVPYVLGGHIINYQSKRVSHSSVAPHLALYIIGLACALMPSMVAALSVLVGLPEGDMYYFAVLSYLASGLWSVWWYYRYSKPAKRGLAET